MRKEILKEEKVENLYKFIPTNRRRSYKIL